MGNKFGSFVKGFAGGVGMGLTWKKAEADAKRAEAEEERKKKQDERDATTFDRNTEEYERTKRVREETAAAREKIGAALLNIKPTEQNSPPATGLKMPTTQQLSAQAAPAAGIDQGNGATAYPMADRTASASPVAAGLAPEKKPASKTINIGEEIDSMNSGIYTLIKNGTLSPEEIGKYQRLPLMLQNEGIMEAAKYLKAGQPEMAEKALNSVGDFKGNKLVSIKKGVVNKYGVKNDTTIATFKMPDGRNFVIDTALLDMGAIGTEKNIELMMKAAAQDDTRASNAETGRHNRATEATAALNADAKLAAAEAKEKTAGEKGALNEKDIFTNVVMPRFGGKLDAMGQMTLDERNKDVAMRASVLYTQKATELRSQGLATSDNLAKAASAAADQAEREKALGKPLMESGAAAPKVPVGTQPDEPAPKNYRSLWGG